MDYSLYKDINGLSGSSGADDVLKFLANDLHIAMVALVALVFLIPWRVRRFELRCGAVFATAAAGLGLLINQPISHAVDRVRPYVSHPAHAHLVIPPSHDPSFPSDHATGAFALATGMLLYDRLLGGIMLVLAAVLAFARVYVGVHYPGDVLGGAAIGVAAALVLMVPPVRRLLERFVLVASRLWDRVIERIPAPSR